MKETTSGPGEPVRSVTRKKTVVVSQPPAWKLRKQEQEEKEKAGREAAKEAKRQEKARLWAERQAQEREARRAAKRKPPPEPKFRTLMTLEEAVAEIARCWPALALNGLPRLLAINIREAMIEDIRSRNLDMSVKKLKRCLSAITRSDAYLEAMAEGVWRIDIDGQPVDRVTADEAAYAVRRKEQEHARLQRKAEYEQKQHTA
ncbi:fertility inhibition protein FinO [Enterobacter hormaechei]|uniref:fertility inhibition protein FinO n=1 Tax=Enterobacter hormaechei TaxID=158836 RepID=UPI002175B4F5|nr:fertility inhibition protein FinO [Enterobacter hormaechei]UVZ93304.1 fertility inhibition protein FinO [Enterobacter hormaechei]